MSFYHATLPLLAVQSDGIQSDGIQSNGIQSDGIQSKYFQIVLFEQDYLSASGTRRVLEQRSDYAVRLTERAEDLVSQCEQGDVDLVLLEATRSRTRSVTRSETRLMKCSESSPEQISHELKGNPKTTHIPIVLLSSQDAWDGFDGYCVDAISRSIFSLPGTLEEVRNNLVQAV